MQEVIEHYEGNDIGINHPFSYESLAMVDWADPESIVERNGYQATVDLGVDKNFVRLKKATEGSQKPKLVSMRSTGYKLHMSIFDPADDDKNLSKAWSIVVQTSIEHDIKLVKIIRNEYRSQMRSADKFGKEITWYAFHNNLDTGLIKDFLTSLTLKFVEHGIMPGQKAVHDENTINGSNYFTYRNDRKTHETYNPFKDIVIDVKNQPQRQAYALHTLESEKPKRLSMEDSAINREIEYNQTSDDQAKCSKCCHL